MTGATGEPSVWRIVLAYVLAFLSIVSFSVVAAAILRAAYPDLSEQEVYRGLAGLLAGAMASSAALLVTLVIVARPLEPARLRLLPGRETGDQVAAMIVGTLALGQALDSATMVAGIGDRGAMATIRRALQNASGPDLFTAVVVIGVLAGAAEEAFFRGYMQTGLRQRWSPMVAVGVTSLAFAALHLEPIHAVLALGLGIWLGFITERAGSALPAVAAHVINNSVFTVLTATVGTPQDRELNLALLTGSAVIFAGCALWIARLPRGG